MNSDAFNRKYWSARMSIYRNLAAAIVAMVGANIVYGQTSAAPFTTGYRYDLARHITGVIRPDPDGTGTLKFLATRNTYNAQGMLTNVEVGELAAWMPDTVVPASWTGFTVFNSSDYAYDDLGRKISERKSSSSTVYALTQFNYDTAGRLKCTAVRMNPALFGSNTTDACSLGTQGNQGPDRIAVNNYDNLSRITSIQKAYGTPDQLAYVRNYYWPSGPLQSSVDANGNLSYFDYDGLVRLYRWYFPAKSLPSPGTIGAYNPTDFEGYSYDSYGNRTSLQKRDGNVINYAYDGLNRLTTKSFPSGLNQNVYFDYDLRGLQLFARFGSTSGLGITTGYNGFGRVKTSTINMGGVDWTLSYLYDNDGNRTRVTHPDGNYFVYGYDGLNRLYRIFENANTTPILETTYSSRGLRSQLSRGGTAASNVATTTYTPDAVNRLQTLTHNLDGAATTYDETLTFGYNSASQVTSRTLSNASYSFNNVPTTNTSYLVNGLNEYTSVGGVAQGYDANGNFTSDGAGTIYGYDLENRLVTATGGRALTYDPNGRLFQTVGASGTSRFLYDGDALVGEYNASNTLVKRYVHGAGVDEPLVQYTSSTVAAANRGYLFADHQGTVVAIANSSGTTTEVDTYDPYGVPGEAMTAGRSRFRYTGQIALPDLAMYYYKARIYYPGLGRFMQTDPIGYNDDTNIYAYVKEDPINLSDPQGTGSEKTSDPCGGNICEVIYSGQFVSAAEKKVAAAPAAAAGATGTEPVADDDWANTIADGLDKVGNISIAATGAPGVEIAAGLKVASTAMRIARAGPVFKTTKEAAAVAQSLGYRRISALSNGEAVFQKGNRFITRDTDGHIGGAWKMADSVKALGSKETRMGTFSVDLKLIGD